MRNLLFILLLVSGLSQAFDVHKGFTKVAECAPRSPTFDANNLILIRHFNELMMNNATTWVKPEEFKEPIEFPTIGAGYLFTVILIHKIYNDVGGDLYKLVQVFAEQNKDDPDRYFQYVLDELPETWPTQPLKEWDSDLIRAMSRFQLEMYHEQKGFYDLAGCLMVSDFFVEAGVEYYNGIAGGKKPSYFTSHNIKLQ